MKCDVCGENIVLNSSNGKITIVGLHLVCLLDLIAGNDELEQKAKLLMYPYECNRDYYICFPCLLERLGVKPYNNENIR